MVRESILTGPSRDPGGATPWSSVPDVGRHAPKETSQKVDIELSAAGRGFLNRTWGALVGRNPHREGGTFSSQFSTFQLWTSADSIIPRPHSTTPKPI